MIVAPITLRDANAFVEQHHRHSVPVRGCKFAIAALADGNGGPGDLVGVAIVGRPVARGLDDGWTAEVLRVCTLGGRNVCSFLYGRSWRIARAMGYRRLVTYTLKTEPGASLRASGWTIVGEVSARSWDTPARPRVDRDDRQARFRWEVTA